MVRQTSIDAYRIIKENGLLNRRALETLGLLAELGPATGGELINFAKKKNPNWSHARLESIPKRLSELRKCGTVSEKKKRRECEITGLTVIVWYANGNMPIKFDKPMRHKCAACKGKGYIEEQQGRLF